MRAGRLAVAVYGGGPAHHRAGALHRPHLAPGPAQAAFLTPEEREWLCARNARIKARRIPILPAQGLTGEHSVMFAEHSTQQTDLLDGMRTCLLARSMLSIQTELPLLCSLAAIIAELCKISGC